MQCESPEKRVLDSAEVFQSLICPENVDPAWSRFDFCQLEEKLHTLLLSDLEHPGCVLDRGSFLSLREPL